VPGLDVPAARDRSEINVEIAGQIKSCPSLQVLVYASIRQQEVVARTRSKRRSAKGYPYFGASEKRAPGEGLVENVDLNRKIPERLYELNPQTEGGEEIRGAKDLKESKNGI